MKTNKQLKTIIVLMVTGFFSIFESQAQVTYFSGNVAGGNGCTPSAGVGGANATNIGCGAGKNSCGYSNTFIGGYAGYNNLSDSCNVGVGFKTLFNQAGINCAVGGQYTTYNVAVGNYALFKTNSTNGTNGIQNTAIGHNAVYSNTIGTGNAALGFEALKGGTEASQNVAVGYQALYSAPAFTNGSTYSTYNTAIGYQALYSNAPSNTGNGNANTAIGHKALYYNTTGQFNTATGYAALYSTNVGYDNTADGYRALFYLRWGSSNTAMGKEALFNDTSGSYNTAMGNVALYSNLTGDKNTAIGLQSMYLNTTGSYNVGLGKDACFSNTIGNNNTCVGYSADVNAGNLSNATAIGNGTVVTASNKIFLGDAVNSLGCYNRTNVWAIQSDGRFKINVKEDVKGLSFIMKLRPVTYNMDTKKLTEFITQNMTDSIRSRHIKGLDFAPSTNRICSGFIAQEVEKVVKDCGFTSSTIVLPPSNNSDPYSLNMGEFIVPLVKAMQEQQKMIEKLQAEIDILKANVERKK